MSAVYGFDRFELDANLFELRRDGAPVNVQAKVLDLVFYLVRNRGRLITKAEILANVWAGVFVGEASVSHAIMEARKALDDPADDPRAIVTVRGRGYRFVAPVVERAVAHVAPVPMPPRPPMTSPEAPTELVVANDAVGVKLARIAFTSRGIRWGRVARKRPDRQTNPACASNRAWR
jgi:DNA-binding winged helix-turn-helix (wHTH) protein